MSESISTRVGRIVSGSLNSLVDAVENMAPDVVMEQAIREIDSAIEEVRAELGKTEANKHLAVRRLEEENRKHENLTEQLDVAVKEERDDLAEAAISRQLDIEAQIPVLEGTIQDTNARQKELEGFIKALQAKKREMRDELKQFRESRTQVVEAEENAGNSQANNVHNKVSRAESAFDRVMERQTGLGHGSRTGAQTASQLAELEDLSRKNRVAERLAALKAGK